MKFSIAEKLKNVITLVTLVTRVTIVTVLTVLNKSRELFCWKPEKLKGVDSIVNFFEVSKGTIVTIDTLTSRIS